MKYCNNLLLERGCYDRFRRIMGALNKSSTERLSMLERGGLLYIPCEKMTVSQRGVASSGLGPTKSLAPTWPGWSVVKPRPGGYLEADLNRGQRD